MDAHKVSLYKGLIEANRRYFHIPIYQREFRWGPKQCGRLLRDVRDCGRRIKAKICGEHYAGTIVYSTGRTGSDLNQLYLIDGQQRITTVLLIVKVMSMVAMETKEGDSDAEYVYRNTSKVLFADSDDRAKGYKLRPGERDLPVFQAIMKLGCIEDVDKNPVLRSNVDNQMLLSFHYIYSTVRKWVVDENEDIRGVLHTGLDNLSAVEIILDSNTDDPQAIFESINSLGIRLDSSDLIRNFLLMTTGNQEELYRDYWAPLERDLIGVESLEMFVRHFLMAKIGRPVNSSEIYPKYVDYVRGRYTTEGRVDKEKALKELYDAALLYSSLLRYDDSLTKRTNALLQEFRDMGHTTTYTFLLHVLADKRDGVIDEDVLDKVLNLLIVYLVRRTISRSSTNVLRSTMLALYQKVFGKLPENKSRYYASIKAFIERDRSQSAMPSDDDVRTGALENPLYANKRFSTYLLYSLENGRYVDVSGESVLAEDVTVEHILPQTLSEDWRSMLGPEADVVSDRYLDTLGNLSLSSRVKNSQMGNDSFESKKEVLISYGSKFKILNGSILSEEVWGEEQIISRCNDLISRIFQLYLIDEAETNSIVFEDYDEKVLESDEWEYLNNNFRGRTPVYFRLDDETVHVDSFKEIIDELARILYDFNPGKMEELAFIESNRADVKHPALDFKEGDKYVKIAEDIYVRSKGNSATAAMHVCYWLISNCLPESVFTLGLKKLNTAPAVGAQDAS